MNTARSARAVIDAAKSSGNIDCFLVTGDIAADEQPRLMPVRGDAWSGHTQFVVAG